MSKSTCCIAGCVNVSRSRGMCNTHYSRWRLGKDLNAPVRTYTIDGKCSIEGCSRTLDARGFCGKHLARFYKYGDPLGGPECKGCGAIMSGQGNTTYCSDECKPSCIIEGCTAPSRRHGRCSSHSSYFRSTGRDRINLRKWSERADVCPICGGREFDRGFREVCSAKCFARRSRMAQSGVPVIVQCVLCDADINRLEGDRMVRSEVALCRHCRHAKRNDYAMSAAQLAERDGTDCSICGDEVDMKSKFPDQFCPSVDHVVARANGGSEDPSNLALAHLWCNQVKNRFEDVDLRIGA